MNFFKLIITKLKNYNLYLQGIYELSLLSDKNLADIGIARCEIKDAVKGRGRFANN